MAESQFIFKVYYGKEPEDMPGWHWQCDCLGGSLHHDGPFDDIYTAFKDVMDWGFDYWHNGDSLDKIASKNKELLEAMVVMGEDMQRAGWRVFEPSGRLRILARRYLWNKTAKARRRASAL